MKAALKRTDSLSIAWQGLVELFVYLPVLLIVAVYLLPASAVWAWVIFLPICYWAGAAFLAKWTSLRLINRLFLAAAIGGLHACLFMLICVGELRIVPSISCGIIGAAVAARGMSNVSRGWTASFPNSQLLIGVMTYVAMQPLKLFMFKKLIDYNGLLIIGGIASVILFFFFANERHLNSETVDTSNSPATLAFKRQNRMLMAIIVTIICILALFRQIQQAIERFFRFIIDKIMSLLSKPREENPIEEPPANVQPPEMLPTVEEKPPSDWVVLLEQILKIIGIAFVIIASAILLFIVIKKLVRAAKRIIARLMERGQENRNGEAGFTDEVEQLMTLDSLRKQMGNQLLKLVPRKRKHEIEWNELTTNTERIRYLYGHLIRSALKRGYILQTHLTPRETALDLAERNNVSQTGQGINRLVDAYEQVRYGNQVPGDQQVDALRKLFDQEKK